MISQCKACGGKFPCDNHDCPVSQQLLPCDSCGNVKNIWFSAWHEDVMLCTPCNKLFKQGDTRIAEIVEAQDV